MAGNRDPYKGLKEWLETKFALRKLDNALIILSSVAGILFVVGNVLFGKEVLSYTLPLYFIGWMMPIWSGYFLGAIFRGNLADRARGWVYLLAGTPSYLIAPFIGIYLPLGSYYDLDPLSWLKSLLIFAFYLSAIVFFAVSVAMSLISRLFRTVHINVKGGRIVSRTSVILTSVAVMAFTGSIGGLHIWSAFGISIELLIIVAAVFLSGFLFEYMALRSTRTHTRARSQ